MSSEGTLENETPSFPHRGLVKTSKVLFYLSELQVLDTLAVTACKGDIIINGTDVKSYSSSSFICYSDYACSRPGLS